MPAGDFCRVLTLLRKERGITQKEAAASLGVSQALLSHYEKGIRECGLDFVLKAADFYGVSCDYLLGRTADRNGSTISVEDLVDNDQNDKILHGSVLPVLNKRLITSSINILFDYLLKNAGKDLVNEVSGYIMCAFYKMFRRVYSANPQNSKSMFSVPESLFNGYTNAYSEKTDAVICAMLDGSRALNIPSEDSISEMVLTTETFQNEYPQQSAALFNLIQQTEKNILK